MVGFLLYFLKSGKCSHTKLISLVHSTINWQTPTLCQVLGELGMRSCPVPRKLTSWGGKADRQREHSQGGVPTFILFISWRVNFPLNATWDASTMIHLRALPLFSKELPGPWEDR